MDWPMFLVSRLHMIEYRNDDVGQEHNVNEGPYLETWQRIAIMKILAS